MIKIHGEGRQSNRNNFLFNSILAECEIFSTIAKFRTQGPLFLTHSLAERKTSNRRSVDFSYFENRKWQRPSPPQRRNSGKLNFGKRKQKPMQPNTKTQSSFSKPSSRGKYFAKKPKNVQAKFL